MDAEEKSLTQSAKLPNQAGDVVLGCSHVDSLMKRGPSGRLLCPAYSILVYQRSNQACDIELLKGDPFFCFTNEYKELLQKHSR